MSEIQGWNFKKSVCQNWNEESIGNLARLRDLHKTQLRKKNLECNLH